MVVYLRNRKLLEVLLTATILAPTALKKKKKKSHTESKLTDECLTKHSGILTLWEENRKKDEQKYTTKGKCPMFSTN